MKIYRNIGFLLVILALFGVINGSLVFAQDTASSDETACSALLDSRTLVIIDAKLTEDEQGSYCRVSGLSGNVHYVVALPLQGEWNGRFLMLGDGGHDGDIDLVRRPGYVVANSDIGHSVTTEPGATFAFNNREAEIDYGYRGVHVTVLAAKRLAQDFYGRPPDYSYFDGCSTGGRQAMVEAQRYPQDFDGIVAGALFGNAVEIAMEQVWSSAIFFYDVDGDGVGFDNNITQEDIDALSAEVLAAVDVLGNDKIQDGIVGNPIAAQEVFTEADIDAFGEARGLTPGQIQAIKDVYAGPHDSTGENQWYKGKALGTEYAWGGFVVPTPEGNNMSPFQSGFSYTFVNYLWFENDPGTATANPGDPSLLPEEGEYRWLDFDFDRNTPMGATTNPVVGPWDPNDGGAFMREIINGSETDLTPLLIDNDAKYLLYHGWGDPLIGAEPSVDYYNDIVADTFDGDAEVAGNNVRLFMVPGMGHCAGGVPGTADSWDKLEPLVEWVENGVAPDSIVVTHMSEGTVDNERIICPWPLQPTYIGPTEDDAQNDPSNWVASNFECQPQE